MPKRILAYIVAKGIKSVADPGGLEARPLTSVKTSQKQDDRRTGLQVSRVIIFLNPLLEIVDIPDQKSDHVILTLHDVV